jgi:hypothetical protein
MFQRIQKPMRGLRENTGRDQEIVTSRNPADYCVTYNTQYKENYIFQ